MKKPQVQNFLKQPVLNSLLPSTTYLPMKNGNLMSSYSVFKKMYKIEETSETALIKVISFPIKLCKKSHYSKIVT